MTKLEQAQKKVNDLQAKFNAEQNVQRKASIKIELDEAKEELSELE